VAGIGFPQVQFLYKAYPCSYDVCRTDQENESIRRGAIDFIQKPFQNQGFQNIFTKIDAALKQGPKKVLIVEENASTLRLSPTIWRVLTFQQKSRAHWNRVCRP
jgi:hypothetical protein